MIKLGCEKYLAVLYLQGEAVALFKIYLSFNNRQAGKF